jgi:hypothetical protein
MAARKNMDMAQRGTIRCNRMGFFLSSGGIAIAACSEIDTCLVFVSLRKYSYTMIMSRFEHDSSTLFSGANHSAFILRVLSKLA